MKVKSNLDEILYDRIIECLIRGDYAMGEKISLNDLAEKFEVSRTPVVQAVKLLANDGVLTVMSTGRVYVPEYQYETVRQICEVRLLIEAHALEVFMARTAGQNALRELTYYADKCRELNEQERYVELSTMDLKFHKTLVKCAQNEILDETYARIQGRFLVVNYLIRPLRSRDFKGTVDGHYHLLDAIRNGNLSEAQATLRDHIDRIIVFMPKE